MKKFVMFIAQLLGEKKNHYFCLQGASVGLVFVLLTLVSLRHLCAEEPVASSTKIVTPSTEAKASVNTATKKAHKKKASRLKLVPPKTLENKSASENAKNILPMPMLNPIYVRGLNQRTSLIEKARKLILDERGYEKPDHIAMVISKEKNTMEFMAASRLSVTYEEAQTVMDDAEKFGDWSMRNINLRPNGRSYFLNINRLRVILPLNYLDANCTFQVLMIKLFGTITYHFFHEKIEQGSDIYLKLKEVNQVITNMEGHFFTLNGNFLRREGKDAGHEVYLIMSGEADFLSLISPFLPLGLIKTELMERLDRMMNNLYDRIDEIKLKHPVKP